MKVFRNAVEALSRLRQPHPWIRLGKAIRRSNGMKLYAYYGSYLYMLALQRAPMKSLSWVASGAGAMARFMMPGRRRIALKNLRTVYKDEKDERELRRVAARSTQSFLLSIAETIRFYKLFESAAGLAYLRRHVEGLEDFLTQAKQLHDQSGGCIFLTPHLGCYGMLPYLFSVAGIPIVIPLGTAGNEYIEQRWCPYGVERRPGGETFVSKKHSLNACKHALRQGRSVGMMADQRTLRGVSVKFFGQETATTPVPALLAVGYQRPIIVGACYRQAGVQNFKIVLDAPLWPVPTRDSKAEIVRLTAEINQRMEGLIRQSPEQYLWLHDRWKISRTSKRFHAAAS